MKTKKMLCAVVMVMMLAIMFTVPAFAAGTGDVAGAIEGTWTDASAQIKTVVNNVVFPVIDLVLAVFFFAKLGMAYFDYRKHGQFEWTAPAILFACLMVMPPGGSNFPQTKGTSMRNIPLPACFAVDRVWNRTMRGRWSYTQPPHSRTSPMPPTS